MLQNKILYLWDLANTIFYEKWNKETTGYPNYDAWLENKLNLKVQNLSPREYEKMYKEPYKKGYYFNLDLMPGAKEVLTKIKHNEAFTSGVKNQVKWRAEYLNPKIDFNILNCFQKINSTFDYVNSNIKNRKMLMSYLNKKFKENYKTIIYTDDKKENCLLFQDAAKKIKNKYKNFSFRIYYLLNNNSDIKKNNGYFVIGNLYNLLKNENIKI